MATRPFNPALTGAALRDRNVPMVGMKKTVKVIIEFCPETGECEIMAPTAPFMFYGILKVAEDTYRRMQPPPIPDSAPPPGDDGGKS